MFTADRLIQFIHELKLDLPDEEQEKIGIAFREILLNAIEHGGQRDPDKKVYVSYVRTQALILYYIRDPGEGFSLESLPQAALYNPPDEPYKHMEYRLEHGLRPGGFGIMLSKRLVDELMYNEQGNEVLLIKYLGESAATTRQL
jgi:anti-sigma regulatory factor (Ser/Thr protein kinase)